MAWRVYGKQFDQLNTIFQKFTPQKSIVLKAIRLNLICYNDPDPNSVFLEINSENNGNIGSILTRSNGTIGLTNGSPGSVRNADNGIYDVVFEFDEITLRAGVNYYLKPSFNNNTMDDASHWAWKTSYPYPVYQDGFTGAFRKLPRYPYSFTIIGADF